MSSSKEDVEQARISKIAGRYLLFDIKDIMHLRRNYGICSMLTGVTPQNPSQTLFSGLPLEIAAEEAKLLVDLGAAYVEDDCAAHLAQLTAVDGAGRRAYIDSFKRQRQALRDTLIDMDAEKDAMRADFRAKNAAKTAERRKKKSKEVSASDMFGSGNGEPPAMNESEIGPNEAIDTRERVAAAPTADAGSRLVSITPATSSDLIEKGAHPATVGAPPSYALRAQLNSKGFYTTPGLRFAGDYSVYPGDPFRFHAHFTAVSYGWDEGINMLDLVGSARMATGVKKGLLIGAERPGPGAGDPSGSNVRSFSLEWAAM
ncbi:uncharacterized protein E0L32_004883 [Thyridium curvatum]|uniref:tRNA-splicing endonuclease subunit Sen34 n=1 Tax=Thyridium curvatum TaxID=1093900 RepID=A0A507B5F9_9PEZI|nr:uncharacterized protein E0L32_004883 [Thyridium curvatum]TPX15053.1 hypothetical protein E0L32_004883 [Thyridium curvatum]